MTLNRPTLALRLSHGINFQETSLNCRLLFAIFDHASASTTPAEVARNFSVDRPFTISKWAAFVQGQRKFTTQIFIVFSKRSGFALMMNVYLRFNLSFSNVADGVNHSAGSWLICGWSVGMLYLMYLVHRGTNFWITFLILSIQYSSYKRAGCSV